MTTLPPDQFSDKMGRALGFRRALESLTFNGVNLRSLSEEGTFLHPDDPTARELILHFERAVLARRFQAAIADPYTSYAIQRALAEHYNSDWSFLVTVGGKECLVKSDPSDLWLTAEELVNEVEVLKLDALWDAPEPGPMAGDPLVAQELSIWGLRSSEKAGGCGHIALDVIQDPKGILLSGGFALFAWRGQKVTELARFRDGSAITCQECEAVIPRAVLEHKNIESNVIPY